MKDLRRFYNIILGNLVIIILIATAVTLYSMFSNLRVTVKELSQGLIQNRLALTAEELNRIFYPIKSHLITTKMQAQSGVFGDFSNTDYLNACFLPIIKNSTTISSILIANDLGKEYMLLNRDSIWVNRLTKRGNSPERSTVLHWNESESGELTLVSKQQLDVAYDPATRPWFQLAIEASSDSIVSWTQPYTFYTTKQPGITASMRWEDREGVTHVFAVDVLLSDLSKFTTTVNISDNGKVIVLSDQLEVLGLPRDDRFLDEKVSNQYVLKKLSDLGIPLIDEAISKYRVLGDTINLTSFRYSNGIYWAGAAYYPLNTIEKLIIGVIVPETDFARDIKYTRHLLIGGLLLTFFFLIIILYAFLMMKRANKIIAIERDKNEQLLLNTLPVKVVNDLKINGRSDPQKFNDVTVCFADIVGFTQISSQLDPKELINELNDIYTLFDEIMARHDCERIKTIGDAYLAVCGMPEKNDRHAEMMLSAALEIIEYIEERNSTSKIEWKMRIGIHSGIVVGGIVGVKKYIYDVFGDTINTASRMESYSMPMHINLSEDTYKLLKDSVFAREKKVTFEKREPASVKGKGMMNMYFARVAD